jgi:uroporphyrin-III C-methyltransferase
LAARAHKVAVGKRAGQISTDQRFINRCFVEAARQHQLVIRLKGGDPMLFGRAQEEIAALEAANIAFEVVPGITAALAASAALKVSLTARGVSRSVTFATPSVAEGEAPSDWLHATMAADSAVLYMAKSQHRTIAQSLIAAGRPATTPVAIVENATHVDEQRFLTTLGGLVDSNLQLRGPALLMIGDVFATAATELALRQPETAVARYI